MVSRVSKYWLCREAVDNSLAISTLLAQAGVYCTNACRFQRSALPFERTTENGGPPPGRKPYGSIGGRFRASVKSVQLLHIAVPMCINSFLPCPALRPQGIHSGPGMKLAPINSCRKRSEDARRGVPSQGCLLKRHPQTFADGQHQKQAPRIGRSETARGRMNG